LRSFKPIDSPPPIALPVDLALLKLVPELAP
jgi:hypothetical protein